MGQTRFLSGGNTRPPMSRATMGGRPRMWSPGQTRGARIVPIAILTLGVKQYSILSVGLPKVAINCNNGWIICGCDPSVGPFLAEYPIGTGSLTNAPSNGWSFYSPSTNPNGLIGPGICGISGSYTPSIVPSKFSASEIPLTSIKDPLANVPDPTTTGLTANGSKTFSSAGNFTINPGTYNTITIGTNTIAPNITMNPGIYWINSALKIYNGTLSGNGVMIVNNTGVSDAVWGWSNPAFYNNGSFGTGSVNLTPPTANSGGQWPTGTTSATYAGISYWVPRSFTQAVGANLNVMHAQSTQPFSVSGIWYFRNGCIDIRSNIDTSGNFSSMTFGTIVASSVNLNDQFGGDSRTGLNSIIIKPCLYLPFNLAG